VFTKVRVDLNLPVVLVIRVEDSSRNPVPAATVSASVPSLTATLEIPLNGDVVLLGTPGHYRFRLISAGDRWLDHEGISANFEVSSDDRGERLIVLRVPD
jgi:hypothetical protein